MREDKGQVSYCAWVEKWWGGGQHSRTEGCRGNNETHRENWREPRNKEKRTWNPRVDCLLLAFFSLAQMGVLRMSVQRMKLV